MTSWNSYRSSEFLTVCTSVYAKLTMRTISEDEDEDEDEDEEDTPKGKSEVDAEKLEDAGSTAEQQQDSESKIEKAKAETTELVGYTPDELQEVNKDILNAEITQLEGEPSQR